LNVVFIAETLPFSGLLSGSQLMAEKRVGDISPWNRA